MYEILHHLIISVKLHLLTFNVDRFLELHQLGLTPTIEEYFLNQCTLFVVKIYTLSEFTTAPRAC